MAGWYEPITGKCSWWRESVHEDDAHDITIKAAKKRVECMCSIEGHGWNYIQSELPSDCPEAIRCRYYIKSG
ncbi:MAG: hypothetical protein HGB10_02490 [Coriobacteriia bacterium]|nr:hypothetical protein [Coriobacteriia bacterium]